MVHKNEFVHKVGAKDKAVHENFIVVHDRKTSLNDYGLNLVPDGPTPFGPAFVEQ
jgi:hypothetical protein